METDPLVEGQRARLFPAGLQNDARVASRPRKIKESGDQLVSNTLTVIIFEQPHALEFGRAVIQFSERARADRSAVAQRNQEQSVIVEVMGSDVIQVIKLP